MESKLQYYMRVCKGASFEKFFKVLDNAHERSGKNKIYLFFDMLHCMKRYGAGYNDYVIFDPCELYRFVLFVLTQLMPGEQQIDRR